MIVGIDLGTTNSAAGIWRNGETVLIPNALGHLLTPSIVSIADDGQVVTGLAARERLSTHPHRTAAVFKRYMGTNRAMMLGGVEYRPEELSALILRALKADAEAFLGEPVTEAVITVPAYFNDLQRKATQTAGTLAGLKVTRLLTEPTAAALAYGITARHDDASFLVIDLGGGTFDVSLLHCFDGVMEVRATAGDTWLGGEDFVDVLVAAFMKEAGVPAGVPPVSSGGAIHGVLRRQAELAKRHLSDADTATIVIAHGGRELSWMVNRTMFEQLAEPLLARLRLPIERALRDARVDPDTVSQVVLAGGASRMPMVRRLIARLFKRLPLQHINPDEAVARGAAICAGLLARSTDLREVIMTDVAPFTMGIAVFHPDVPDSRVDRLYLPIIERNTVIPASRSQLVETVADNQPRIDIEVYQGEAHRVKDNILLGRFATPCPPAPAGAITVDVRFTYDTSGLLEVEATVLTTGQRKRIVIESNPGMLSASEIASRLTRLTALKHHPREDAAHRALVARAERLYEEQLGLARMAIGHALTGFAAALESQDPDRIRVAGSDLRRLLDSQGDQFFL